jgi:hypothetical protein
MWIHPEDENLWWSGMERMGLLIVVVLLSCWLAVIFPILDWPALIVTCLCSVLAAYTSYSMPGLYPLSSRYVRDHIARLQAK